MFRVYARYYHSNTHLILAQDIVRAPTIWGCVTLKYPRTHEIGQATSNPPAHMTPAGGATGQACGEVPPAPQRRGGGTHGRAPPAPRGQRHARPADAARWLRPGLECFVQKIRI